jgi:hypothetical protein
MKQAIFDIRTGEETLVDMTPEEEAELLSRREARANRVPQKLSRLQVIEQAEAEPDGKWGELKAALQSHPTAWDKFMACDYVSRSHPLIPVIGAILQKDDAGMDQFFRDASKR